MVMVVRLPTSTRPEQQRQETGLAGGVGDGEHPAPILVPTIIATPSRKLNDLAGAGARTRRQAPEKQRYYQTCIILYRPATLAARMG